MTNTAAAAPVVHDPLLDAINAYRAGVIDYNTHAGPLDGEELDAYADATYLLPMRALDGWDSPATSLAGAVEAIRLVHEESQQMAFGGLNVSLLAAALGYFETIENLR